MDGMKDTEDRGRASDNYDQALKHIKGCLAFPWHRFKTTVEEGIICTFIVPLSEWKCLHLLSFWFYRCMLVGGWGVGGQTTCLSSFMDWVSSSPGSDLDDECLYLELIASWDGTLGYLRSRWMHLFLWEGHRSLGTRRWTVTGSLFHGPN